MLNESGSCQPVRRGNLSFFKARTSKRPGRSSARFNKTNRVFSRPRNAIGVLVLDCFTIFPGDSQQITSIPTYQLFEFRFSLIRLGLRTDYPIQEWEVFFFLAALFIQKNSTISKQECCDVIRVLNANYSAGHAICAPLLRNNAQLPRKTAYFFHLMSKPRREK